MNYRLIAGNESKERLELLFSLAPRLGEASQDALIDHLYKGHPESIAASLNMLSLSNFNRALNRLNKVAATVEKIKELDWDKFKSVK